VIVVWERQHPQKQEDGFFGMIRHMVLAFGQIVIAAEMLAAENS
jgi:hypothetical protein